jgi:hypothetical protein
MTLAELPGGGLWFPYTPTIWSSTGTTGAALASTNAACAWVGQLYIAGRAASKTISSSGGKIFWFSTVGVGDTWANAGSALSIGIQGVDLTTGNSVRPNGTYGAVANLTGGDGNIVNGGWNSTTITSGTSTLNHGDWVAITWDMTARAGSDSVHVTGLGHSQVSFNGFVTGTVGGSWSGSFSIFPRAYIQFDDGTLGIVTMGCDQIYVPGEISSSESFNTGTTPKERGMLFQVPWACKIDAIYVSRGTGNNAAADLTLNIYDTPLGTPSSIWSLSVNAESTETSGDNMTILLGTEVSLSANHDYCLAILPSSSTNVTFDTRSLHDTNLRNFLPGGTNIRKGTRNSGSFSAESPATTLYNCAVRISQVHDTNVSSIGGGKAIGGTIVH